MPKLAELQTKLDGVRREVRNLTVMGMDPNRHRNKQRSLKSLSGRREQSNVSAKWRSITRGRGKLEGPCGPSIVSARLNEPLIREHSALFYGLIKVLVPGA